jgi:non-ribosomal peptide synthetase component F
MVKVGEIVIAGKWRFIGYINRTELTNERFISNTFQKKIKVNVPSGDLGKVLANGQIQCLGRIDEQVKSKRTSY